MSVWVCGCAEAFMKNIYLLILPLIFIFYGCENQSTNTVSTEVKPVKIMDLSSYSDARPDKELNILFLHHSCGGHWLADRGTAKGENCIYEAHPNGGGLRSLLEQNGYAVHEASYGSIVGDKTDIEDWPAKFRDQMDRILKTDMQDQMYTNGSVNNIVMFKSCYPNNNFEPDGSKKGRTVQSATEAYNSLLPYFREHPETLFVVITAPPLVQPYETANPLKASIKKLLGRYKDVQTTGICARRFNNRLKDSESGWLSKYDLNNVVVFDLYDILTKDGQSNWAGYPTKNGTDSHPSSEGNSIAAERFVPFLNKAVRRAGLDPH
jgi:hypothetical protein